MNNLRRSELEIYSMIAVLRNDFTEKRRSETFRSVWKLNRKSTQGTVSCSHHSHFKWLDGHRAACASGPQLRLFWAACAQTDALQLQLCFCHGPCLTDITSLPSVFLSLSLSFPPFLLFLVGPSRPLLCKVGRLQLTRVCWIYPQWTKISELNWTNDFFRLAFHIFPFNLLSVLHVFFSCFYASVFNCWSCFAPDSCTAVGGREIQNGSKYCATRFQWALSLCIPNATQRPRTISPLFTRFLFQNHSGLPSRLRFFSEFFQTKFAEISRIFYNEVKIGQLGSL